MGCSQWGAIFSINPGKLLVCPRFDELRELFKGEDKYNRTHKIRGQEAKDKGTRMKRTRERERRGGEEIKQTRSEETR